MDISVQKAVWFWRPRWTLGLMFYYTYRHIVPCASEAMGLQAPQEIVYEETPKVGFVL